MGGGGGGGGWLFSQMTFFGRGELGSVQSLEFHFSFCNFFFFFWKEGGFVVGRGVSVTWHEMVRIEDNMCVKQVL